MAGQDPTYDAPSHVESTSETEDQETHWIEIELVDEDDKPVGGERGTASLCQRHHRQRRRGQNRRHSGCWGLSDYIPKSVWGCLGKGLKTVIDIEPIA